jgi:hypothetical protein
VSHEPQPPVKIVKPRERHEKKLPLIAIGDEGIMVERTGEFFDLDQLPQVILAEPSSIIVGNFMGTRLLQLHEAYKDSTTFQYKLTPVHRDSNREDQKGKPRAMLRDTVCTLVGFPGHYHHPIDPSSFIRKSIDELDKRNLPDVVRLMDWGRELRKFCECNGLKIKASAGGLAAQLLRDRRFYPNARRKAPRLINDKVREKLPGNYYKLFTQSWRATYLDMKNAHHTLAQEIDFPCVDSLHAYGYFSSERNKEWARARTKRFEDAISKPGLFHVRLSVPHKVALKGQFPPPYMESQGVKKAWIYSNEIPLIKELGGTIEAIYCAIISDSVDEGLSKYAKWALEELDKRKDQRAWLKPTLHSAYGVLAGRPRPLEIGWRLAKTKEKDLYPMGGKMVPVSVIKSRRPIEPKVVNVIHRGMIESEQRVRVLRLAKELEAKGGRVICIYADSLFVKMPQLPLLPSPWNVQAELTGMHFHRATSFTSDSLIRLPGIPRRLREPGPVKSSVRPTR